MRSGEWTQSMALSLAMALEAVVLREEVSPTEVLKDFRGIQPDPQQTSRKLGEHAHEEYFLLTFESSEVIFPITVRVTLLCEDCSLHTHNWVS